MESGAISAGERGGGGERERERERERDVTDPCCFGLGGEGLVDRRIQRDS
jgi:hypothetical protein